MMLSAVQASCEQFLFLKKIWLPNLASVFFLIPVEKTDVDPIVNFTFMASKFGSSAIGWGKRVYNLYSAHLIIEISAC